MTTPSNEPICDSTIADLHRVREQIVEGFRGNLDELTADAQRRQKASGRKIIRKAESVLPAMADDAGTERKG